MSQMNKSEIRVEVCRAIAQLIREKHEDGDLTPHSGPIAENSAALQMYEHMLEQEIETMERRGGQL